MKLFFKYIIVFLFLSNSSLAQVEKLNKPSISALRQQFNAATLTEAKISIGLNIVDNYINNDVVDTAQQWIYKLIALESQKPNDTAKYFIQSRQTEIFYFSNLHHFALASASKALLIASKLNDSALKSDIYAFKGYIYEALDSIATSIQQSTFAKNFFPKRLTNYKHSLIAYPQIINQLAQMYVLLKNADSAMYFNTEAYNFALNSNAKNLQRPINMCLATFGNIYLLKQNADSALYYYNFCKKQCLLNSNYDIIVWVNAKEIVLAKNNPRQCNNILSTEIQLISTKGLSPFFQNIFFKEVLPIFEKQNNKAVTSLLLSKMLALNENNNKSGNKLVQDIANQYVESENALLRSSIESFEQKKWLSFWQVLALFLLIAIIGVYFYYKQKQKQKKLQQVIVQQKAVQLERSNIAKELQDEMGSGLTRINYVIQQKSLLQKGNTDLQYVKTITQSTIDSMKEIIWAIKEENNTINEMLYYLKEYMENFTNQNQLVLHLNMEECKTPFSLSSHNRRQIFLVIKALLLNVVQHSKATTVTCQVQFINNYWQIILEDNGIGFSYNEVLNLKSSYGIKTILKRLQDLSGTINWESKNGTRISITMPNS